MLVSEATRPTILIDVRTPREYASMHLPGAINIPVDRIHEIENIDNSKDAHIEVYCQTGNRSEYAKNILKTIGYHVTNIGGIIHNMHRL